jgi:hypothetical protein
MEHTPNKELLNQYEIGKNMGQHWYTQRIMSLIDQNNKLKQQLKNVTNQLNQIVAG